MTETLRTVMLYGHLGRKFGRVHQFAVANPREAIQALCANFREFRRYLIEHSEPGYRVLVNTTARDLQECLYPVGGRETIRIIPVTAGSSTALKIIIGAALIVMSGGIGAAVAGVLGPGTGLAMTISEFVISAVSTVGWSLVLGGVSELLYKAPKTTDQSSERPENQPSYAFNGPVNTVTQGNCVPICYGQLIIGSQQLSAGITTEQLL